MKFVEFNKLVFIEKAKNHNKLIALVPLSLMKEVINQPCICIPARNKNELIGIKILGVDCYIHAKDNVIFKKRITKKEWNEHLFSLGSLIQKNAKAYSHNINFILDEDTKKMQDENNNNTI